jgi:DHA3 family tetracycline resistance protein-like MFS transporter
VNNTRAYWIYLITGGASAFFLSLTFTVTAIYRLQTVHLDPLQLVLVGTVLEATCFLFEVPTGVVADTFSRRLSVILGFAFLGVGMATEGVFPVFAAVLTGQVIAGIGYTFLSGAHEAWIADEIGEEHLGRVFMRNGQVVNACALLGTLVSVTLGSIQLGLPIVLGGALTLCLALFLVFTMPETGFKPTPRGERTTWQAMGHTLGEGVRTVRRRPSLVTFLIIAAFVGLTSEGWDRLWEANFILNIGFPDWFGLKPVVWLGLIGAAGGLLGIGASEWVRRNVDLERRESVVRNVRLFTALRIASVALFAFAPNFGVALVGRWGKSVFASVQGPLYSAWLTQSIDSRVRATVLSMTSQVDAIGQIAGGPAIGAIGNVSVRAAIALSGLLMAPVLALYGRAHRQDEESAAQAALAEAPVLSPAPAPES